MFKTISAALIAGSLLAAPAMAGTVVIKSHRAPIVHSFANANAKVVVIKKHRHHRMHRHVVVKKKVFVSPAHRTVIVKRKHI